MAISPTPNNRTINWLPTKFGKVDLSDIINAKQHSRDFNATRAEYILHRLRFMLLVFTLAFSLWIPVDFLTLTAEHFAMSVWARLTLSAVLFMLWMLSFISRRPGVVYSLLSLSLSAVMAFYVASMLIMNSGIPETPLAGYSALPFLMVALTGLFPLTLTMSIANIALISAFFIGLSAWQGSLGDLATLNELWVIALVSGCSLWIQSGQLLMLLKLYRESTRDPLTGLINRRVLIKQLANEQHNFEELKRPFSLLMFDLDRFKRINDTYGHQTGDLVLKMAATTLSKHARKTDTVARYGGEEFMLIMPGLSIEQSRPLAEQILSAIEQQSTVTAQGESIQVTTSIGLTEYQANEGYEATIERADALLYQAKQRGRNQIASALQRKEDPADSASVKSTDTTLEQPLANGLS